MDLILLLMTRYLYLRDGSITESGTYIVCFENDVLQVNINTAYKSNELRYSLNKVGVRALFMADRYRSLDLIDVLQQAVPELQSSSRFSLPLASLIATCRFVRLVIEILNRSCLCRAAGTPISSASVPELRHVALISGSPTNE